MAFVVGKIFDSYAEFDRALAAHEKAEFANFVKQTNVKLEVNVQNGITFADVNKFKVKRLHLRCKKGGAPQVKQSVRNDRQTSSYRSGCPAKMKIAFNANDKKLFVEKIIGEHNHVCSPKIFATMPKQRRLSGEGKKFVEDALKVKANVRLLQHEVKKKFGTSITLKDVHNLNATLKSGELNTNDRSPLELLYDDLIKREGMIAEMFANEENELQGIYIQDERMRKYFMLHPELVIMDATYKVNDRRMPLFIMLVVDGNGESQIAALFILKSENYDIVTKMLNKFKAVNENHEQINVILRVKSFTDRRAYSECFPQAQLQLCIFHVIQAWKHEIKTGLMEIDATQKTEILQIMQRMMYASTEQHYMAAYNQLNAPLVKVYFDRNWHELDIRKQWAAYHTNNFQIEPQIE